MVEKLVVAYIGDHCSQFLDMSFKSVFDADKIIFVWGTEDNKTKEKLNEWKSKYPDKFVIIERLYEKEHLGANGRARNVYLNYLKENFKADYALVCDPDEVLAEEGIAKIKKQLREDTNKVWDMNMRHIIGNLNFEDSMTDKHWTLHRLFHIEDDLFYDETEHPLLRGDFTQKGKCDVTLWHLAYCTFIFDIKKRYDNHMAKSNIHTKEFLKQWRDAHYFNSYPKKQFDPTDLPNVVLEYFGVDKDEIYFRDRQVELKHALMVHTWARELQPKSLLDVGCARGPYLYFWKDLVPGKIRGYELSSWAVNNSFVPGLIEQKDASEDWNLSTHEGKVNGQVVQLRHYDVVTFIDLLEHLSDDKLDKVLKNAAKYGNRFIFSIPFAPNDPNLYNDKTHVQFKTKEEWIKLISSYGIKVRDAPSHWPFAAQTLVGENEKR